MKTRRLRILAPLITLALVACGLNVISGSGNAVTEDRRVDSFSAVSLEGNGELVIAQGGQAGLTVEAEKNLMKYVRAEFISDTLTINMATEGGRVIRPTKPIVYHVTAPNLNRVQVDGSGDLQIDNLETDQLEIKINGSGGTQIGDLQSDQLIYRISGSGDARITGQVAVQSIQIDGSGNYQAGDLQCQETQIQLGGSGEVTVWVQDRLDVAINGSGTVNYYGTPQISQNISGSGELNNMGEK
jgi:cytoskeletal protein CcmA (bactofilin family)